MNLYCELHRLNHEVTGGDVERIVYALLGLYGTEQMLDTRDDPYRPVLKEYEPWCPLEALRLSRDAEGFGEHTDGLVAARRRFDGKLDPVEAWRAARDGRIAVAKARREEFNDLRRRRYTVAQAGRAVGVAPGTAHQYERMRRAAEVPPP